MTQPLFLPRLRPRLPADLWVILSILAVGVVIYARTASYPFVTFDDPSYVVDNPHVRSGLSWANWSWAWSSFEQSNWHPLTWLSLMLDAQVYGLWAGGYHLTNLGLHLLNTYLLFWWLRRSTGALWPSTLTAFFFVAHPLHVESVAWVTERKDVLSGCFFLLTLLAYTRYARSGSRRAYLGALSAFALGLTAKPMLVTVPLVLCLVDDWPLGRWGKVPWRRLICEKAPFAVLSAGSCVVTVLAQRAQAMVPLENLPLLYRVAAVALDYATYLKQTVLPWNLIIYYPYWRALPLGLPALLGALLALVTVAAWLGRPRWPFAWVGWLWFLGMLVPVIGVVQVGGQAVADRYTYLPHIGLFVAVVWSGAEVWHRRPVGRPALGGLAAAAAVGCMALAYQQVGYWRSGAALFEHAVTVLPHNGYLCRMYGNALLGGKQPQQATSAYLQAWKWGGLNTPDKVLPLSTLLLNAARFPEAVEVLEGWQDRPNATPELLGQLGLALTQTNQAARAEAIYGHCVERFPDFVYARFGWAELLQKRGAVEAAAAQDEAGLRRQPDNVPALQRLAWNYTHSGDPQARDSAEYLAGQAVRLTGGRGLDSVNLLAFTQAVNGKWEEAVATAVQAQKLAEETGGDPAAVAHCRERLERYQRRSLSDREPRAALR